MEQNEGYGEAQATHNAYTPADVRAVAVTHFANCRVLVWGSESEKEARSLRLVSGPDLNGAHGMRRKQRSRSIHGPIHWPNNRDSYYRDRDARAEPLLPDHE